MWRNWDTPRPQKSAATAQTPIWPIPAATAGTALAKPVVIRVVDANYRNRGELLLLHEYNGVDLKLDRAVDTLANLQAIWSRPVHLQTIAENQPTLVSHDGTTPSVKKLGENDDPRKRPAEKPR